MSDKYKSDSFLNNYKKEFNFQNSSKRITLRKRIKEYNKLNSNTIPNIILNKEEIDIEPDHIIAMQFEDEFSKTVQGINKKTVRTKEYGIKKGDVIEFVKSFPDHTESLFVTATTDELIDTNNNKIEILFNILDEVQNDLNLSNEQNKLKTISNFTELTGTSEYELKIPINELEEVRNRLKCNL